MYTDNLYVFGLTDDLGDNVVIAPVKLLSSETLSITLWANEDWLEHR